MMLHSPLAIFDRICQRIRQTAALFVRIRILLENLEILRRHSNYFFQIFLQPLQRHPVVRQNFTASKMTIISCIGLAIMQHAGNFEIIVGVATIRGIQWISIDVVPVHLFATSGTTARGTKDVVAVVVVTVIRRRGHVLIGG